MSEWETCPIGSPCNIIKGKTGLASAIPGKYSLVTTQFDTEAVCIPLVSSTGHDKKALNHVHYQESKFALGTIFVAAKVFSNVFITKFDRADNGQFESKIAFNGYSPSPIGC
ncbi:MAG: hypothetical protein LBJ25_02485 [Candidatus Margulisbacteria bacterium]|jgi:hypothetical protein|nr:hypothetical protein [Candidatus Margulisiibacteriota bacterium]